MKDFMEELRKKDYENNPAEVLAKDLETARTSGRYVQVCYNELVDSGCYLTQDALLMMKFNKAGIPCRFIYNYGKNKKNPIFGYDNDEKTAEIVAEFEKRK